MRTEVKQQPGNGYLADVDGLRAIAVLAVILFHFDIGGLHGGYVGVDIFFVISGYLISLKILDNLETGTFSFGDFYMRRVRRLAPAFITMLVISSITAIFTIDSANFIKYAESLVASLLSLSNLYFYFESSYFDTQAHYKPLLHTWSLSVEEQFYLVWPALLLLIFTFAKNITYRILIVIGLLSLAATEYILDYRAEIGFYLPFFRVYEFVIGALCIPLKRSARLHDPARELLFIVGLVMISASFLLYGPETRFPGLNALLPCVGTALVIIADNPARTGKLLSNPALVFIGLLSYSLYLYHWPIYVFVNYMYISEPTYGLKISMISLTFLFGYLSYRYIETPTRRRRILASNRKLVSSFAASMLVLTGVAILIHQQDGWNWRESEFERWVEDHRFRQRADRFRHIRIDTCHVADKKGIAFAEYDTSICMPIDEHKENYLVLGDSHAADLWYALSQAFPEQNFQQATAAGCRPLLESHKPTSECYKLLQYVLTGDADLTALDGVILSWRATKNFRSFMKTIEILKSRAPHIRIIVFGPSPEFERPVPRLLTEYRTAEKINSMKKRTINKIDDNMKYFFTSKNIDFISRTRTFCPNLMCPMVSTENIPLFIDAAHWSDEGARYFGERLIETGFAEKLATGSAGD